jgi:hypothetical protein
MTLVASEQPAYLMFELACIAPLSQGASAIARFGSARDAPPKCRFPRPE